MDFFAKRARPSSSVQAAPPEKRPALLSVLSGAAASAASRSLPFADLCVCLDQIEATTKRLAIIDILTEFLAGIMQHAEMDEADKLGPDYGGVELGLGDQLLMKAISLGTGRTIPKIKSDIHTLGDIGLVAAASKSTQQTVMLPAQLTLHSLFQSLCEVARSSGTQAVSRKIDLVRGLMSACRQPNEAKYLFRLLSGRLRIGLAEQTILAALANASVRLRPLSAATATPPVEIIKSVYNSLPNYEVIIGALVRHGLEELPLHCRMAPGIPLKPMLAHPTKSIGEVLDRFENMAFTCEYKYDGERAQIHVVDASATGGSIAIFSRNSENMLEKYPDIAEVAPRFARPGVRSYVLDCEVVACSPDGRLLPFQVLSTRKRKDVVAEEVEVRVAVFAFDLLYLDGEPLMSLPLRRRRQLLTDSFDDAHPQLRLAQHRDTESVEEMQGFLEEAVAAGCEGLMVKTLDVEASYEPSKRSRHWLKIKKDYLQGIGDSVDLVPIGGYLGKGKRTGCYGGFLLACYDPDNEELQAICKIGTGFSDESLAVLSAYYGDPAGGRVIEKPKAYYRVGENVRPDVWFEASQVWEVKAADFSVSPVYSAAWCAIEPNKGVSLRFPRFIRVRDDKCVADATSAEQIAEMYQRQQQISALGKSAAEDDDDYY